ncbi:MAG: hypothetical protein WC483_03855 [Candidatus Paceibacterota bacterium]
MPRKTGIKVVYEQPLTLKTVDRERATIQFVFSTDGRDRQGDIIVQNFELGNFNKNPVFINSHRYGDATEVIGRINSIRRVVMAQGAQHEGEVEFAVNENPKAKIIFDLYAGGFLHAVSVGGIPLEFDEKGNITKLELLEVSACAVPANAAALAKQKGIDTDVLGEMSDEEETVVCCCDCGKEIEGEPKVRTDKEDPEIGDLICASCHEAAGVAVIGKDIAETVSLAQVIAELHWLLRAFNQNEVSEEATDKMVAALVLLLEALRMEAVIGQKGFVLDATETDVETVKAEAGDITAVLPLEHRKNLKLRSILKGIESMKSDGETKRSKHAGESPDVRAENIRLINRAIRSLLTQK